MKPNTHRLSAVMLLGLLPGCGDFDTSELEQSNSVSTTAAALRPEMSGGDERRSERKARALAFSCDDLLAELEYPDTVFESATDVEEGELAFPGQVLPAHCLLVGKMHPRVSPVDGQQYAIGFEMRLPTTSWSQRFFYQANGGLDGEVVPAVGAVSGGGPLSSALLQGFAVISSDAGHNALQNPWFGLDPQARLDYGYQAVGELTPMAKSVLTTAYGRGPAFSYIGGCSNGGRHTMVAAARYPVEYDGYLVGAPGFQLPQAAVANIYGAQQYAPLSGGAVIPGGPFGGLPDLSTAFTQAERQLLSDRVLERCDALDGIEDGMVHDTTGCQAAFDLDEHVPTCEGTRDGSCLSTEQKLAIGNVFAGATTSTGEPFYSSFPFDTGYAGADAAFWEFIAPVLLDPAAVGFVFAVPPQNPATFIPPLFALTGNVDEMLASASATDSTYTEAATSFMVPPDLTLEGLGKRRRMIVYHGVSDPIFSADDTRAWFESLDPHRAKHSARLYLVPGMSHCANGPAADQFDLLTPLVRWVERGERPRHLVASVRGATNPGGANVDVPSNWTPQRTRPLCAYPHTAVYRGGDVEQAESFRCE